jgi:drug/metabolite transporter (DMT)-like permease
MASESGTSGIKAGLIAVTAASILFSAKSVFFKLCYRYGTPPVVLQTIRGMFSLPFYLAPFLAMRLGPAEKRPPAMTNRDILIVAWLGFSGYYLASIFDMVGLLYVSAGMERLILFIYPTLVVLFSAVFFRKPGAPFRIPRAMAMALLLSYAGIALSFGGEAGTVSAGGRPYQGGFLVFLSAVFYALFLVGQGRMVHRLGPQRLAAGCMMMSSVCVFAQFLACYPLGSLAQPAPVYLIAGLTSVFCNVLPIYLYGYGVHRVGAGMAAVASSVGPVSTLALAGVCLGERTGVLQVAGLALVVAGTLKLGSGKEKPVPVQVRPGPAAEPPKIEVSGSSGVAVQTPGEGSSLPAAETAPAESAPAASAALPGTRGFK